MLLRTAVREIKRRKTRSVTSVMGYALGVAFLVIIVTLAQSYNLVAAGALNRIGTHFAVYIPASTICPCETAEVGPFFKGTYTPTFNSSIVETIKALPGVADAAPCLIFRFNDLTICGVNFDSLATKTNAVSPDTLLDGDYSRANEPRAAFVDSVYAELTNIKVGDDIVEFGRDFTVVGIVNPSLYSKPAGVASFYAPLSAVQEIAKTYGDTYGFAVTDINVVLVEISAEGDAEQIDAVEQAVLETLEDYGGQPGAIVGYQCGSTARKLVPVTEESAWAISLILLISVMVFALRSQFASVVERTREIGILKAIGWTDSDVVKQVFLESFLQGCIGGAIGVGLGYSVAYLVPYLGLVSTQNLVLSVSPFLVLLGLSLSIVGGTIAGMVPAWRAAKLQPADALRRF